MGCKILNTYDVSVLDRPCRLLDVGLSGLYHLAVVVFDEACLYKNVWVKPFKTIRGPILENWLRFPYDIDADNKKWTLR